MNFVSFESLGLHHLLVKALYEMQYAEPTPVQRATIPLAITGRDLLVSSQTGSGKTAAFLLPILHRFAKRLDADRKQGRHTFSQHKKRLRGQSHTASRKRPAFPRMLVLSPTRELAIQTVTASRRFSAYLGNIMTIAILGGMPYSKQLRLLGMKPDILVATPGRLIDHIQLGRIDLSELEVFVLDEADRMLDMGFIDDIRFIATHIHECHQTMLFSATLDGITNHLAEEMTYNAIPIQIQSRTTPNKHIKQIVHYADDLSHKHRLLIHWLRYKPLHQALIFTATKKQSEILANWLTTTGLPATAMHGDLPQPVRNRILDKLQRGQIKILVATDIAARGIDVPDISHVFNFDMPTSYEDYIHRIGRTGRAGRYGTAISLVTLTDRIHLKRIEHFLQQKIQVNTITGLESKISTKKTSKRNARKISNHSMTKHINIRSIK